MKKKIIYWLVALIVICIALFIALPFFFSSEAVRKNLLAHAQQITGRQMEFSGTPKVSFNPFLGIEIENVVFKDQFGTDESKPILSMPKLKAKLGVASAFAGQVELTDFQFVRPIFNLKIYSSGQSSWQFPEGMVWDALVTARQLRENSEPGTEIDIDKLPNISLGNFSILDGVIEYENEITGTAEKITNLNGTLDWPNTHSPWNFSGNGIWRGDAMTFSTQAELPILLLSGGESELSAKINSEPVNLEFSGKANRFAELFISGNLAMQSPSLRRFSNLLGAEFKPGATLGEFSATGSVAGTLDQFALNEATFSLDGNKATGNLNLVKTEELLNKITGTLAFETLQLAPYLLSSENSQNTEYSFFGDLNTLIPIELDLRVSSPTLSGNNFEFQNFAGGIKNKDGEFALIIGNLDVAEGLVVGDLRIQTTDESVRLESKINGSNISTNQLSALSSVSKIYPTGSGNINVQLSCEGKDINQMIRNLTGETTIELKNGQVNGIGLEEVLSSIESENSENKVFADFKTDSNTPFKTLNLSVLINRGVGWITKGNLNSEDLISEIAGKIDLHLGTLALRGNFVDLKKGENEERKSLGEYFIGGTLQQPLYVLD